MTAQKGREVLLKVEAAPGGGTYNTVGGLRTSELKINSETVDVTNKDSAGVRTLLAAAGVTSMSISASGVFSDDSNYQKLRVSARAGTHLNYKLVFPADTNDEVYTGAFQITELTEAGEYNGEMTYSVTLESAGAVTVAAT